MTTLESNKSLEEMLDQTLDMLQRRGRVSYRALQRQFHLDDAYLADLKAEIVEVLRLAVDQDHTMLVWTGDPGAPAAPSSPAHSPPPGTQAAPPPPEAERRQLAVMFCDLVGSTALSAQLDPEDLREVVRAYQTTCAEVIQRFDGHIAQYLGDGLLVYFGYPQAHEDNAQRAIRAGLGIIAAMVTCNTDLEQQYKVRLAVRLGIHTGLVVIGEMGGGGRQEQLALGETPNIAAWLQGFAAPDTVVISEATARLTQGFFLCQALGAQAFKGLAQPLQVYHVLHESAMQTRLDVAAIRGLTPLVGREHEVGVLRERWAQVTDGPGHVILLSGEPGIGKSRLVQVLKEQVADTPHVRWECRCSPYHQHSALYPLIDLLQRLLRWQEDPSPVVRLAQLEQLCRHARLPLPEMVSLLAALLSFPLPADRYPPMPLLPRRQKQQMLEGLLTLMAALAARQPLLFILEDVHWIDPSTLDFLQLLLDQGPPARVLSLLTSRPTVQLPDSRRPHLTSLVLTRLAPPQVETMVVRLTAGKTLPPEVRKQVIAKTDGVPLFVEELTKMVLESGLLTEMDGQYTLTGPLPALAIPTTLHDSLMARLDRLAAVKTVAQLGATIGRQFPYPLLQAVAALDDQTLQAALHQLVDAELLYGQGVPPDATYLFKHALIQEAAYQSLLRSTRQQYHQQIAQVIAARFPEIRDTQPELLAYHYTEAGLGAQALEYWRRAGERANQRWAFVEASHHLTRGLEVLRALPESPEDVQYELTLQIALLTALQATRGFAAPEVGHVCTRARALCQQVGESQQLLEVLLRLSSFYLVRGELHTARELGEACHSLAQRLSHAAGLLSTYRALGITCLHGGAFVQAREHFAQALRLYHPSRPPGLLHGRVHGRACFTYGALALWFLGYPAQAWHRMQEALTLVQPGENRIPFRH
jgi:class 3 adenylate cyclase/tetratricopeptide (TPR) repeat protein